jgi:hypothetical protein
MSVYPVVVYYIFLDAPGAVKNISWEMKLLAVAVILYPVVIALAWFLSYINPLIFYIPFINFLVIISILAPIYYSALAKSAEVGNKIKFENIQTQQKASRDFVCSDGSFFSLKENKGFYSYVVYYYSADSIKNPGKYPAVHLGGIKDGKAELKFDNSVWKDQIKKGLSECKNKDGKAFFDIYPVLE